MGHAALGTTDLHNQRLAVPLLKATPHSHPRGEEKVQQRTRHVSFIIPTLNEFESIEELHKQILSVCNDHQIQAQVVFVDDGSTDSTWTVMQELVRNHAGTEAIRFRRNFGKAAALSAGAEICKGEIVITMDADLQDDPQEIPRFLEKLDEGFDVVSGWKQVRHDPLHKVLPSRVFNWLVSRLTGVKLHDHNCGFKAYRREIFDEVELYGERHRFIPVLAAARGFKPSEIVVEHHARRFGHSKYGFSRMIKGFLDLMTIYLLTGFSSRPLHLIGVGGMVFFSVGGVGILSLSTWWVLSRLIESVDPVHLHEKALFYYCILALLLGAQFLLAGLLAELVVARTHGPRDTFSIAEHFAGTLDDSSSQTGDDPQG
ncbi:MAG: glycosyltransferase family 2 protein [Planctomycetaceae bacterium]|nr:glycosyltransferase family 2 protein [Planctomycetaceae bacterium]